LQSSNTEYPISYLTTHTRPVRADRRAISEQAALGGTLPVRLAWGRVQEAAALHSLARLFPDSVVEEVGMFVPDLGQLPGSWGVGGSSTSSSSRPEEQEKQQEEGTVSVPPLGASPDAVICHRLDFTRSEIAAAAARLRAGGPREEVARGLLAAAFERVRCLARSPSSPAAADGEEASVVGSSSGGAGGAEWQGGGSPCGSLCGGSVQDQILRFVETTAAGLDGGSSSGGADASSGASSSSPSPSPSTGTAAEASSSAAARGEGSLAAAAAVAAVGGEGARYSLWVREVVEVKSHCPFIMK
jgi:hypothetical protein